MRLKHLTGALLLVSGTLVAIGQPAAQAVAAPVTVTVNTRAGLATMPETGLGINDAIWDTTLGTAEVADLLGQAGVKMRRYPGGSYSDIYHWETHTAPGGYVAPNTDFDTFMAGVRRTGAQPMIVANYGTGTPAEAAGWVHYANVTKRYGVKYWTVGNENYGNGHYGSKWEEDNHADKSPNQYASLVVEYADAMKAVDPSIKVGAVLTMPGNWPDAIVAGGDAGSWNQVVLSVAGSKIDFVDVHWYPGGDTPAESLSKSAHIADAMYLLRQQIARHAGAANAARIGISMTELNVGVGRNTQPGALFLAETYTGLLEQGLFTVQWWNVHNGIEEVSTIGGQTDYKDYGLLSSGNCLPDGVTCEPALNTPFAPYYGLTMVSRLARPGDQFIRAATDQPLVSAHAARRPNGDLTVLLSNMDPDNAYPVNLSYAGYTPAAGAPLVHSYTNGATGITTARAGTATSQTLPPYSMMVIELRPQITVSGPPSAPGQPTVSAVSDTSATISWPAGGAGAHPVAKHEVYRQLGAVSEQWGETTGTSFTVHNLRPGTRYTVNVLTRDTAGKVSWASSALTFTTSAPATSTCNVRWTYATDWGNGYVASIDITNTSTSPINGWTLTYAWPTGWQRLDNGWNGTWTQDAGRITVTPADWNSRIEPGATANVGFVGVYAGPNVQPILFTLNGMLCSTN
ncbi:cellulose binding domain-containing protein [Allorhizocola rhizosphaerae]|uniref:cellulose binding domain-containing protein n=1 Tax=Allorhizocola rhizosphaerae TaxID=1872709 RepID=UPI000E3CD01B|nr:cellulose binding domain-containing protein [Allorhizocola rhizosphaerae]